MQEEQDGYFSKCFLIKTKKRSTHQSLRWASWNCWSSGRWTGMRKAVFLHNSGAPAWTLGSQESTLPARLLLLCAEQISLMWWWETSSWSPDSFSNRQTDRSPGDWRKETISMNLHFPSTSGEDSQSVLLPPLAGYTYLNGDSSLAIATLLGPSSASAEVNACPSPDHNRSCTRAHDHQPIVL